MAHVIRETRTVQGDDVDVRRDPSSTTVAARIVNIITGIILTLLGMRFIFALLGANKESAIANFVYSTTQPLVDPFFSLFNYRTDFGISAFEFQTLVAIAFYTFVGWLLVQLLTVGASDRDAVR